VPYEVKYYKCIANVIHIYLSNHKIVITMSEVITIRVSRGTRSLMKENNINWSEDIRNYIETRAKSFRLNKILKTLKPVRLRKGTTESTLLIREDRDSR
jgi:hypothetical protein